MPFYRFQIDTPLQTPVVLQRIQSLTRVAPGFWQSMKQAFSRDRVPGTPFIGTVEGDAFYLYRDIRYRNSFLPRISGQVHAVPAGSRVSVRMHLHPIVAGFMVFWLGGVGIGAWAIFNASRGPAMPALIPAGMFLFGVALTLGAFYPEAIKARRLLEQGVAAGN
jgi:hypothetical protein